jgi:hypothetical protein
MDRLVDAVDLLGRQPREQLLALSRVALVGPLGGPQARRRQPDDHLASVRWIGGPGDQLGPLQPVEDLGHAAAGPHHDLAQLGGGHAVWRAAQLEEAQDRVVDEEQTERVEAAVLKRVDEQPDPGESGEQPHRTRLRQVPRLDVHLSRQSGRRR